MKSMEGGVVTMECTVDALDTAYNKKFILKEWEEEFSEGKMEQLKRQCPYIFAMIGQIESYLFRSREIKQENEEKKEKYQLLVEKEKKLQEELQALQREKQEYVESFTEFSQVKQALQEKREAISRGLERKKEENERRRQECTAWMSEYFKISHKIEKESFSPPKAFQLYVTWKELLQRNVLEDLETERKLLVYLNETLQKPETKRRGLLKTDRGGWKVASIRSPHISLEESKEDVLDTSSIGIASEIQMYQRKKREAERQVAEATSRFYEWLEQRKNCLEQTYIEVQQDIRTLEEEVRNSKYNVIEAYYRVAAFQELRQKRRILKNEQEYILLIAKKGFSALTDPATLELVKRQEEYQNSYHDNWVVNKKEYLQKVYKSIHYDTK